jgi:hypothetical protein
VQRIEARPSGLVPWLWAAALLLGNLALTPNLIGWVIGVGACILILPEPWATRERAGKPVFLQERLAVAALYTALLCWALWKNPPFALPMRTSAAQDAVAQALRDPSSAEFRNVVEGSSATCGEVNGKNGFGAFAGFQRFVYSNGQVTFEPEMPIARDVSSMTSYYQATAEFARASQRCYES